MKVINVPIKSEDVLLQVIYGEVYIPNVLDSHGEWMTSWEIIAMAHQFLATGDLSNIDREHDNLKTGAVLVESYVANEGDPIFLEGAWVVGVKLPDDMWNLYLENEINGFSFEGLVKRSKDLVDVEIPFSMTGETSLDDGHLHFFKVYFNSDGDFLGGETSVALDETGEQSDEHSHKIVRGTLTEDAQGANDTHSHTFNFIDALVNDDNEADDD